MFVVALLTVCPRVQEQVTGKETLVHTDNGILLEFKHSLRKYENIPFSVKWMDLEMMSEVR